MDGDKLQPSLRHHVSGHRAVDAAGKEEGGPAAGAHRDASRAGELVPVYVGVLLPHLHRDGDLGIVHIHPQVGEAGKKQPPQLPADFRGLHGEGLVAALGVYLKGSGSGKAAGQVVRGGGTDSLPVLGDHQGGAEGGNAKNSLEPRHRFLHGNALGKGLYVNSGLAFPDVELPQAFQPPADIFNHGILKGIAVEALQDQFPAL